MYIQEEYEDLVYILVFEEVVFYENEELGIVDIMIDVRYGWRKNVKDISVVVIGEKIYKVLFCEYVIKFDDFVIQRYERFGIEKIY